MFLAARADDFVPPSHALDLHAAYSGEKQIMLFEGDHNSGRPKDVLYRVGQFFLQKFGVKAPPARPGRRAGLFDIGLPAGHSAGFVPMSARNRGSAGGLFNLGDRVEYMSVTKGNWVTTVVVNILDDGRVELGVKRGVFFDLEEQKTRIRPVRVTVESVGEAWHLHDLVSYNSSTLKEWIEAKVVGINIHNEIELDVKRGCFLGADEQQKRVKLLQRSADEAPPLSKWTIGSEGEYHSKSFGCWTPAVVVAADTAGRVQLDVKFGVWMGAEDQDTKIRAVGSEVETTASQGSGEEASQ